MNNIKEKLNEIIIKAYVVYTVKMWEVEDSMRELVEELKAKTTR